MMKKNLQVQMTLWILGAVVIISTVILSCVASMVSDDYEAELNDNLDDAIETSSSIIRVRLSRVECATRTIATIMSDFTDNPRATDSILCHSIVGMGCIDAISIVTSEDLPDGKMKLRERYAYFNKKKEVLMDELHYTIGNKDFPTFSRTVDTGECSWSNPITVQKSPDKRVLGYFVPLDNMRGERIGVVYSSLLEEWLGDIVTRYKSDKNMDIAILSASGDTIVGQDDFIKRLQPKDVITKRMKVQHLGWTFIFSIDRHIISSKVNEILVRIIVIMFILMLTICVTIAFVVKYVAKPFMRVQRETETRNAIMEHEMNSAAKTQREMMPHAFPPFPDRNDIDIYACLHPARDVGGDLYDYFIENDELYFCIGDVSGKGTQASLFMSATHYLFRSVASSLPMSEAMQRINLSLCNDNESCMFVTFFFGRLDLKTGMMEYCNAGHNSPIMVSEGRAQYFPLAENMPLGVWDEADFMTCQTQMDGKSLLLLYTDGVTEATDANGVLLGDDETLKTSAGHDSPEVLINDMLQRIRDHANGAEQSDDITMLGIKRT